MATLDRTFSVKNGIDVANTIIVNSARSISNIPSLNVTGTINSATANITTIVTGNALTISTGTGSNGNIIFSSNGTEDMRITNTGFVGIFTATPNSNLSIVGNVWVTTGINAATINATTINAATLLTTGGINVSAASLNAYDQANTARTQANTARDTGNASYGQANTARDQANTARTHANAAYDQANTAGTNALNAYGQANSAANSVWVYANGSSVISKANLNFNNTATINVSVTANGATQANIAFTVNTSAVSGGSGSGNAKITVSDSSPVSPTANTDFWWDSANGSLKIYYNDGTSSQWVDTSGGGGGGGGGTPGGSNLQIQFNDNGSFGANADYTINTASKLVGVDANLRIANSRSLYFGGSQANTVANSQFKIAWNSSASSLDFTFVG